MKKKKAWNNTNPLYRYLQSKGKVKTRKTQVISEMRRTKRSRTSRRSSSSGMSLMSVATAGAIHGVARPIVAQALPTLFSVGPVDSDNVIIGGAGYLGMTKGTGLVKVLGAFTLGNEIGYVVQKLMQGQSTGSNSSGIYIN